MLRRLEGKVRVRRIAFGGGSPNAIAPTDFVQLVMALTDSGTLAVPDWSIELDPRTLGPNKGGKDWDRVIAGVGITRASLGVQTFAPHLQAAIGRIQPRDDIAAATRMLR